MNVSYEQAEISRFGRMIDQMEQPWMKWLLDGERATCDHHWHEEDGDIDHRFLVCSDCGSTMNVWC